MEIVKGSIVRPVHCERSQYMNRDFLEWIDNNLHNTFVVESKTDRSCRLRRVGFTITEEFLQLVERQ